jgi:autotransporter-associated beta strand protein
MKLNHPGNQTSVPRSARALCKFALGLAVTMFSLAHPASATVLNWDGGTSNIATNGDGLSQGAAGVWDMAMLNWDQGVDLTHTAWTDGADAIFGLSGIVANSGYVTLAAPITANSLTVLTTNYMFSDGGNAANTLTVNSVSTAATTTISNHIVNATGFAKDGASTLILLATSPGFTSPVTVNSGTLRFGSSSAGGLPGPQSFGDVTVAGNATLNLQANTTGNYNYSQAISGAGSLALQGQNSSVVMNLLGNNTFGGNASINQVTAVITSLSDTVPNSLGYSTNLTIGTGASATTLKYMGNGESTSRTLTLGGSTATTALDASSPYGALVWNGSAQVGSATPRILTLSGGSTLLNEFAGAVADGIATMALTKGGAGTWLVTASNSFSGGMTLNTGTLLITNDTALGVSTGKVTLIPAQSSSLMGTLKSISNNVTLGSSRTIFVGGVNPGGFGVYDNSTLTIASYLTGTGSVQRANGGSGVVRFANDANDYTGDFSVAAGTAEFTSVANQGTASSLGKGKASTGGVIKMSTVNSSSTLRYVGSNNSSSTRPLDWQNLQGLTLDVTGSGTISWLATANLKSGSGNGTLFLRGSNAGDNTLAQVINDNGGVTTLSKAGGGKWVLTADNTYSGNTTIIAGTLALTGSGTIGTGTILDLAAGATFDVSAVAGGYTLAAGRELVVTNGATATVKGSLNLASASVLMTNVINTPTLTVTDGTLTLGSATAFAVHVNNGGTPLGVGTYKLISKDIGGSVAGTVPAAVTVSGDGLASGVTAALSISGGELFLVVSGGTLYPPVISSFNFAGGQFVVSFSGTNGQSWQILTSTEVAAPAGNWTPVATGTFDGSTVNYTNASPTDPRRFYLITSP